MQFDEKANPTHLQVGHWVLVYSPHEDKGVGRKLAWLWHGPFWILASDDSDVTVAKVYFPDEKQIQVQYRSKKMQVKATWRPLQLLDIRC